MSSGFSNLVDESGTTRLRVRGGASPVQAAYGNSAPQTIADGSGANLTFDALLAGTDLFDRTDPANPVALASGTYAVMVNTFSTAPQTAGGYALLSVSAGSNPSAANTSEHADAGLSAAVTGAMAAGETVTAVVFNLDGAASRDFQFNAVVVKLAP